MPSFVLNTMYWLLMLAFAGVSAYIVVARKKHRIANQTISPNRTPMLLAYYTKGSDVTPLTQGTIGDLHYNAILANGESVADKHALVIRVELPFASSVHIVGIPKNASYGLVNPTSGMHSMERVELEGDYSDYFTLFCEEGMQGLSRYVLDPKAMVFTQNFCQSHSWEIVDNILYFVQVGDTQTANDSTMMFDDVVTFVQEIRPAVEQPLTDQQIKEMTPYGEDRRTNVRCPVCSATMTNKTDYFMCPESHGYLLTGRNLAKVSRKEFALENNVTQENSSRAAVLVCPSCGQRMEHVNYNGSSVTIDSCTHCPYRWLDSGELHGLSATSPLTVTNRT